MPNLSGCNVIEDSKVRALIHDLEEASTFRNYYNCDGSSIQGYISGLLMKAAETILVLYNQKARANTNDSKVMR